MDLSNALDAAAGQTVQPGDFNQGTQRTAASQPLAGSGGGGGTPAPRPAAQPVQPGGAAPSGGQQPPMPQPAGGAATGPRPAAPFAGTQPGTAQVPPPGQPAAGAAANTGQPWSLRGQLQQLGFDTNGMTDDQAAWGALSQRLAQWNQSAQQNAQLAQYGQFYLANKAKFDALMAQGATPAQAAGVVQQQGQQPQPGFQGGQPGAAGGQPAKNLFNAPEYNPEWSKIAQLDPNTGKYVVPMGYDPSIGPKMDRYVEWRRETFEKFLQDPMQLLGPAIVPMIQEEARKLAGGAVGNFADQQYAQQYVQSLPWVFQRDQAGNQVVDMATGQPLLTPMGLRFRQYLQHAERGGMSDIRQQASYATAMVERDAALWQLQQLQGGGQQPAPGQQGQQGQQPVGGGNPPAPGTPAATNQQQQQNALQLNGARRIAGGGGNSNPVDPNNGQQPNGHRRPMGRGALRNRLSGALAQRGIT